MCFVIAVCFLSFFVFSCFLLLLLLFFVTSRLLLELRAQELCENRGGLPRLPVPFGRKATLNLNYYVTSRPTQLVPRSTFLYSRLWRKEDLPERKAAVKLHTPPSLRKRLPSFGVSQLSTATNIVTHHQMGASVPLVCHHATA